MGKEYYDLDLISSLKHYVVIRYGIILIANGFGLHTGIIGITYFFMGIKKRPDF